jgi:hypothetical protein
MIEITLPASDLSVDLDHGDVKGTQIPGTAVGWGTINRTLDSITLRGERVTLTRWWFTTESAFERHCARCAARAALLYEVMAATWSGAPNTGVFSRTFGV